MHLPVDTNMFHASQRIGSEDVNEPDVGLVQSGVRDLVTNVLLPGEVIVPEPDATR